MSLLSAGKYALFVWPAYGVSLVALSAAAALVWRTYRQAKRRLAALQHASGNSE